MCLAYCLIGVGAAPLHTLALKAGLHDGIYYASAAFSPVITFVLYSFVIKIQIRNNQQFSFLIP
ncbi:hypothetical protein HZS_6525 [Henneguya salminicola]|nr:hypothetical protein HZS_6525 [Henneguya salminicola]